VLHGNNAPTSTIPIRWKEQYSTCFICERMSRFDGVKGIWFLTKVNGAWELAGTKLWCGGPLDLDSKDDVLKAVRRNN
jgi:hypothetical protein